MNKETSKKEILQKKFLKNKKIVLTSAIITACALITTGTFAVLKNSDTITNVINATNNYGVYITEEYTEEKNLLPGDTVKKELAAVNTGNVDAAVRISLSDSMDVTIQSTLENYNAAHVESYNELNDIKINIIQAGGQLAWAGDFSGNSYGMQGKVGTDFTPEKNGYYLFLRSNADTYGYKGYAYVDGKYYLIYFSVSSLPIDYSTGYLYKSPGTSLIILNETVSLTEDGTNTMNFVPASDGNDAYVQVIYYGEGAIPIKINLQDGWEDYWDVDQDTVTFYYKKVLSPGEMTYPLIQSVYLDGDIEGTEYWDFNYRLNAKLTSIQAFGDGNLFVPNQVDTWPNADISDGIIYWELGGGDSV